MIPDITYFLNVTLEVAERRTRNRKKKLEKFERNREFKNKLTNAYSALIHMSEVDQTIFGKVVKIDGSESINEITDNLYNEFLDVYNSKNSTPQPKPYRK